MTPPNSTATPVDARTFAIGVLGVTACILLVGIVLLASSPAPSYATGMNDRSGDYILLTQQLTTTNEGVIVIDAASKQLVMYAFDQNANRIEMLGRFKLDKLRKPADAEREEQPKRRP